MVYAVKKFRHYLLANKFVFFVDHQALMYLVNKPYMMGRITWWLLILMEFDFMVGPVAAITMAPQRLGPIATVFVHDQQACHFHDGTSTALCRLCPPTPRPTAIDVRPRARKVRASLLWPSQPLLRLLVLTDSRARRRGDLLPLLAVAPRGAPSPPARRGGR